MEEVQYTLKENGIQLKNRVREYAAHGLGASKDVKRPSPSKEQQQQQLPPSVAAIRTRAAQEQKEQKEQKGKKGQKTSSKLPATSSPGSKPADKPQPHQSWALKGSTKPGPLPGAASLGAASPGASSPGASSSAPVMGTLALAAVASAVPTMFMFLTRRRSEAGQPPSESDDEDGPKPSRFKAPVPPFVLPEDGEPSEPSSPPAPTWSSLTSAAVAPRLGSLTLSPGASRMLMNASTGSGATCTPESVQASARMEVHRLREQLKNRDSMIMEMQVQLADQEREIAESRDAIATLKAQLRVAEVTARDAIAEAEKMARAIASHSRSFPGKWERTWTSVELELRQRLSEYEEMIQAYEAERQQLRAALADLERKVGLAAPAGGAEWLNGSATTKAAAAVADLERKRQLAAPAGGAEWLRGSATTKAAAVAPFNPPQHHQPSLPHSQTLPHSQSLNHSQSDIHSNLTRSQNDTQSQNHINHINDIHSQNMTQSQKYIHNIHNIHNIRSQDGTQGQDLTFSGNHAQNPGNWVAKVEVKREPGSWEELRQSGRREGGSHSQRGREREERGSRVGEDGVREMSLTTGFASEFSMSGRLSSGGSRLGGRGDSASSLVWFEDPRNGSGGGGGSRGGGGRGGSQTGRDRDEADAEAARLDELQKEAEELMGAVTERYEDIAEKRQEASRTIQEAQRADMFASIGGSSVWGAEEELLATPERDQDRGGGSGRFGPGEEEMQNTWEQFEQQVAGGGGGGPTGEGQAHISPTELHKRLEQVAWEQSIAPGTGASGLASADELSPPGREGAEGQGQRPEQSPLDLARLSASLAFAPGSLSQARDFGAVEQTGRPEGSTSTRSGGGGSQAAGPTGSSNPSQWRGTDSTRRDLGLGWLTSEQATAFPGSPEPLGPRSIESRTRSSDAHAWDGLDFRMHSGLGNATPPVSSSPVLAPVWDSPAVQIGSPALDLGDHLGSEGGGQGGRADYGGEQHRHTLGLRDGAGGRMRDAASKAELPDSPQGLDARGRAMWRPTGAVPASSGGGQVAASHSPGYSDSAPVSFTKTAPHFHAPSSSGGVAADVAADVETETDSSLDDVLNSALAQFAECSGVTDATP